MVPKAGIEPTTLPCSPRLGRNTADMIHIMENLHERGITVQFLDDGISTEGSDKMVTTILAAVAQAERERMLERTNEGRRAAMGRGGVRMGRKPSIPQADRKRAVKMVSQGIPKATVAKQLGFSRQKLYDILEEMV